jgi:hypothetical protein
VGESLDLSSYLAAGMVRGDDPYEGGIPSTAEITSTLPKMLCRGVCAMRRTFPGAVGDRLVRHARPTAAVAAHQARSWWHPQSALDCDRTAAKSRISNMQPGDRHVALQTLVAQLAVGRLALNLQLQRSAAGGDDR